MFFGLSPNFPDFWTAERFYCDLGVEDPKFVSLIINEKWGYSL